MSRTRVPGSARQVATRSAVAVLAAALTAGFTGTAAAAAPNQSGNLAPAVPGTSRSIPLTAVQGGKLSPRLSLAKGQVTAFIELAETPAVDAYNTDLRHGKAAAKVAARAAKGKVDRQADAVLANLRGKDRSAKVVSRTRNAVPGVTVVADAAKLRELAASPEVRSIRLAVPKTADNSGAAVLTRVLDQWRSNGKLGDNIRVGIIDTGIDYTHANFGGPGTSAAFDAIDETVVHPGYFPTAKVIGGYDFVGNAYDASSDDPATATPVPDPNPLDCNGHGSHVGGTAAGFGVNGDGSTFTGNYTTLDAAALDAMRIGPGMAPRALLYALKVFGCDGSTNVTAEALDWALDPDQDGDFTDHLDVVNLSLGSDYGAPDDPDSQFVRKLNQNGVLTVFSAGNGGDLYDIGGSPGNTPEALTVASTRDAYVLRDAIEATAPTFSQRAGQYSVNYTAYATLDRTAAVAKLSTASNLDGCQALSAADAAAVAGKIAWLEWDDNDATRRCGSAGRTTNASNAGAVGVLLTSTLENFAAGIAGNAVIPAFQLTGAGTMALRPALNAGTLQVRLAGELRTSLKTTQPAIEDTPSSFTSRGTRTNVKPDVAAPGDTITSTLVGSGNLPQVNSGTSMAAPHVAGIAALVRQAHPDWTTAEVKAAVMNTATHDVYSQENHGGPIEAPNRVGTGRVDAKNALDNQVLAYSQDNPAYVSVGFGVVEAAGPVSITKTIRVVNKNAAAGASFNVSYTPITQMPGVEYQLDRSSITLSRRGVATVRVTLKINDPKALRKVADPTVEKDQLGVARQFVADASGRVDFTPTSGSTVPLRVSVYAAPKPVADISTPNKVRVPRSGQGVLNLSGRGIDQGSGDQRYQSLISALELQAQSPKLRNCGGGVTTDCALNETAKGGDLRFVGAASTAPLANLQGQPENSVLGFGIAAWGDWYNLGNNTIPFVDIDVDGDAVPDFEIFATKPVDTDVLVAQTVNLHTGATVALEGVNGLFGDVDANVFDTNVVVLPVRLVDLGIDPTADTARLSYQVGVAGYYATSNGLVDAIPQALSFDPLKPGLWVQGGGDAALSYVARPGTALVVNRDPAALALDGADSLLLLHHHNAKGDRVSTVKVTGPAPTAASVA